MLKKYLQITIIALPTLILLAGGTYFAYHGWEKYTQNKTVKIQLDNVKLLQSLEYSVLNEIVCVATMSENKNLMEKVCSPTKKTTDSVMQTILTQSEDKSLHALEKVIVRMRNTIKNSGNVAIENLVNGELDKELSTLIKNYKMKLNDNQMLESEKESIQLFSKISDISRATASEKALVSYYLALQKAIPSKNLIYWDTIVAHANLLESISTNVPYLGEYIQDDTFQSLLRNIEDVRIDVMSNASSGQYEYDVATWVSLINKKQKVLASIETKLLEHIYGVVATKNKNIMMSLALSAAAIILSLLGLLLLILLLKNKKNKHKFLSQLVSKISQYDAETESSEISNNITNEKIAYEYITSSFETLYEKEAKVNDDNKNNKLFLNNMSYEIRTPLNGISGYTKLLKETPLNTEQNDYVSVIEDSFENLNTILTKLFDDGNMTVQKLEIENNTFDIVKKVEFAIETYAMKADQKDIILGLYIDPLVSHRVRGDSTKLSQILTNLVDNALESSNAYDSVNIFVEKIHSDNELLSIKFSIKDEGIGYGEDELAQIRNAFMDLNTTINIPNFDMKNLSISNKIIKRMGGKLELESKKGEGSNFFFILSFEKDMTGDTELLPTFDGMKVGLALPIMDINRQVDRNIEAYIQHLGAKFKVYYYDELFNSDNKDIELPELMFFYHNYTRLEGELEDFSKLSCKTALITSGTLRARINTNKYNFSSILYGPITIRKIIRTIAESKLEKPLLIEENIEKTTETSKEFEDIHALVVEDNEISQKIMMNILESFSIEVTVATDGQKAFELRREQDYDIIFMDMDMPVMDGYECTSKILYYEGVNQLKHVPIIALGKDDMVDDDLTNKKTGIDDYITKPFESDKIYDIVKKHCVDIPIELKAKEEDEFIAKVLSEDFLKEDI